MDTYLERRDHLMYDGTGSTSGSHDIPAEVLWSWDPIDLRPEEGLDQDDAADLVGRTRVGRRPSISLDAASHLEVRRRPVLLAKRMPGHASFDQRGVSEKAPPTIALSG